MTVNSVVAGSTGTDGSCVVSWVSSSVRDTWTVVPWGRPPRFSWVISEPVKTTDRGDAEPRSGNGMVVVSLATRTVRDAVAARCVASPA